MEFTPINLLNFLTVAPNLVPEVFQKPSIRHPIAVSLGAIAGALSRYYLSLWLAKAFGTGFPYATIFVNLTGSFLMGLLTTLILERTLLISPEMRLLIAIGFLGSYTTFSSYELDAMNLLNQVNWRSPMTISLAVKPIAYWLGSSIGGLFCLYLGIVVTKIIKLGKLRLRNEV